MLDMAIYEAIRNLGIAAEDGFDTTKTNYYNNNFDELVDSLTSTNQATQDTAINHIKSYINNLAGVFGITGWLAVDAFSSENGLQAVVFKNSSTNQIVIFGIGQQNNGDEFTRDVKYTSEAVLHDKMPVTAFEMAQLYHELKEDSQNAGYEIILAGHSGGALSAKAAGILLHTEGEYIDVAAFGGFGLSTLLDNVDATIQTDKFANFHNAGDTLSLQAAEWVHNFGTSYYTPYDPSNLSNPLSTEAHLLTKLGDLTQTTISNSIGPELFRNEEEAGFVLTPLRLLQLVYNTRLSTSNLGLVYDNQTISGTAGNDVLAGGFWYVPAPSGNTVHTAETNDEINGLAGNDILFGDKGNDTLTGGEGDDTYYGSLGNDTYVFENLGDSNDTNHDVVLNSFGSNDTLQFEGVNRNQVNFEPINYVISEVGSVGNLSIELDEHNSVTVNGQFDYSNPKGVEHFVFEDGEILAGTLFGDTFNGSAGNDVAYTFHGDDVLTGGQGNDTLYGGEGNDIYHFAIGNGQDTIDESNVADNSADKIQFGAGITLNDLAFSSKGNDLTIRVKAGNDQILILDQLNPSSTDGRIEQLGFSDNTTLNFQVGTHGNDTLQVSGSSTLLYGNDGNDSLNGSSNADILLGGAGEDTLIGDVGADRLNGGSGNDLLQGGVDNDTYVFENGWGQDVIEDVSGINQIQFGADVDKSKLIAYRDGDDLIILNRSNQDSLTIDNYYVDPSRFSIDSGIKVPVPFTSPTVSVSSEEFGTYGADGIRTDLNNLIGTITTNAQAIEISTIEGYEVTLAADLMITGTAGPVTSGSSLTIQSGSDQVTGTAHSVTGDNRLSQSYMPPFLVSNGGNDLLVVDADYLYGDDFMGGSKGGLPPQPYTVQSNGGDDYIEAVAESEEIYGDSDLSLVTKSDSADVQGNVTLTGGNDTIITHIGEGVVYGDGVVLINLAPGTFNNITTSDKMLAELYGGNDAIKAGTGNEIIFGDGRVEGSTLSYNPGGIFLSDANFQGGNDFILAGAGNDTVVGDGTVNIPLSGFDHPNPYPEDPYYNPTVYALSSNSTFMAGDDQLYGEAGDDTLIGDGVVISGTSVTWGDDFLDGGSDNDLLMGDGVIVHPVGQGGVSIFNIEAGDTIPVLDPALYYQILHITGGADTLVGGTGNDTLWGGAGNDEYRFQVGDGQDTISDGGASAKIGGGSDTIVFGPGILASNLTFTVYGTDLTIHYTSTDQVTIQNQLNSAKVGRRIEWFQFEDGTKLNYQTLMLNNLASAAPSLTGGAGNDFLAGNSTYQLVQGLSGDDMILGASLGDTLDGGEGNDTIDAGTGQDTVIGGTGNDHFVINSHDVSLYEYAGEGDDTLQLGYQVADLVFYADGDDLKIFNSTQLIATVYGQFASAGVKVEQFQFADNMELTASEVQTLLQTGSLPIMGTAGDDSLQGSTSNDLIYSFAGNDTLEGLAGNDTLIGGLGNDTYIVDDAGDQINEFENEGIDSVESSVSYTLGAQLENLTLSGTNAIDGVGNALENTLSGNIADNTLTGLEGNDTLIGGAGNDALYGGLGNDIYIYNLGDGSDVITDADGTNLLQLGAGIAIDDVNFATDGNNGVIISFANSSETITLQGEMLNNAFSLRFANNTVINASQLLTLASSLTLTGTIGNDTLNGQIGNDTLDGSDGDDSLLGGAGSDSLLGGAGNDTLEGNAGFDTLIGGIGNDTYLVDSLNDVITEALDEGIDTVESSSSYILGPNLENLILTGTSSTMGIGNELDNIITGNAGDNLLYGAEGADTLNGGDGNDTYLVSTTGTKRINDTGGTADSLDFSVFATTDADWTALDTNADGNLDALMLDLGDGHSIQIDNYFDNTSTDVATSGSGSGLIENLLFSNSTNVSFTDAQDLLTPVVLEGTSGDDSLAGGAGNDTLIGGSGNDTLDGSAGDDVYYFEIGDGDDTIIDSSGNDTFDFSNFGAGVTVDLSSTSADLDAPVPYAETNLRAALDLNSASDNSTTLNDVFGNAWSAHGNASIQSTNSWKTGEKYVELDGAGDYIQTDSAGLSGDNYTVRFRTRFDAVNSNYQVVVKGEATYSLQLGFKDGHLNLYNSSNGTSWNIANQQNIVGSQTLQAGQWYDIELTYSNTAGYKVYVDGQLDISSSNTVKTYDAGGLVFGSYYNGAYGYNLDGAISDIYITNEEVLHSSSFTPSTDSWLADNPNEIQGSVTWGGSIIENIIGTDFNDNLTGNSANNRLIGGAGNDVLDGSTGDDVYQFEIGDGDDTIIDSSGNDTFDFSNFGAGVTVDLSSTSAELDALVPHAENNLRGALDLNSQADNSTTLNDVFGNAWSVQGNASIQSSNPWKTGEKHVVLDGSGDGIKSSDVNLSGDNFALRMRVKFNSVGTTYQSVFNKDIPYALQLLQYNGRLYLYSSGNGTSWNYINGLGSSSTLQANQWYDIELNYSKDSGYKVFMDGQLIINSSVTSKPLTSGTLLLGGTYSGVNALNGAISDIYVTNEETLHSSNFTPSANSWLSDHPYQEVQNSITWDSSVIENIIGTDFNDSLTGNSANNRLIGGTGIDTLSGGTGNDTYQFAQGDGQDTINDSGDSDIVLFDSSVSLSNVVFFQTGTGDLQIGYTNSSGDLITVQGQSTSSTAVERFELSNGQYITDADVNQILSDMASYAATNSISLTSLEDVKNDAGLIAIVNGSWHA